MSISNQTRYLLHGENTIASRQKLQDLLAPFKAQNIPLEYLSGKKMTIAQAELLSGESSLFQNFNQEMSLDNSNQYCPEKIFIIEELHSGPVSKKRTQLIETLLQTPSSKLLIFWEKKKLTALMIKKLNLNPDQVFLFTPSTMLWKFIESISPDPQTKPQLLSLYQQVLTQEDPFYVLALLNRQVRLLIQVKTGPQPRLAPFQVSKFTSQAQKFTLDQLLKVHYQLTILDYQLKTSNSPFTLDQELFLLLNEL